MAPEGKSGRLLLSRSANMKRFAILLGVALVGFALLPNLAQAQLVVVGRPAVAPIIVSQPVYYSAPSYYLAPPVTTFSSGVTATYSYYPRSTIITQSAPTVVT